ncbi:MAG: beta-ketoacyl synthase [Blastocatellia bacterium AA13]|nr:MAG: beta-ketoacyl synthase [Blastocatellia bacterium AA13]
MDESMKESELTGSEIAIIGMSCRFPGAGNPGEFWRNLCNGVESLTTVTANDLASQGLDPKLVEDPNYVPFVPAVNDIELFDAGFFGYTPLEAKLMDPQQRLFLECAWEALEDAGHVPDQHRGKIGVFTGAKTNTYLFNIFTNQEFFRSLDFFQIALGNDLACMATRVAYKFDLRGPSYAIHTACSTSLIAVHLACQSLLLGECDMALAGGAAINVPQRRGYFYQKGGILSPDGHCRTFDAGADGSNFGNGVGAVLVKRLDDALRDRDHIYAVIRGSASNNDGARKASYTAPGVEGQTSVLLEAMACAGVEPETLSYIEAHGTATDLGDAIEALALTEAFRSSTAASSYCALGSVKTNIGHLETAAGIAGLIKTSLSLKHKTIPPSLFYERPNPKIDFENSPFYVNTQLSEWKAGKTPRRAGLSSFGIGSANVHVILEEPPLQAESGASRPWRLLALSARTESALESAAANLVAHLEENKHGERYLADVAYTLQIGRKAFPVRRAVACASGADAAQIKALLESSSSTAEAGSNRQVVFLFPGLGDHYSRMGLALYQTEPTFREHVDRGAELLLPELGVDIRDVLYPKDEAGSEQSAAPRKMDFRRMVGRGAQSASTGADQLNQTSFIQPATFVIEYALARQWMKWGIKPSAMIGYSVGEYVAACLSGVLTFEDATALVARRARMIQELPAGAMLAAPLSESEAARFIEGKELSLAAINGPSLCVLAGPAAAIEAAESELGERQILTRRIQASHAFHSTMMDGAAAPLTEFAKTLKLGKPQIPYISNVTGDWIKDEIEPSYWAKHMSGTVRFDDGLRELVKDSERVLLEVGPGQTLTSTIKQHPRIEADKAALAFASMPGAYDTRHEGAFLLETLGRLWVSGQTINWDAFYADEKRSRVPLPTYPFERQRYWVDPQPITAASISAKKYTLDKEPDLADWFYQPIWRDSERPASISTQAKQRWLIFIDEFGLGNDIALRLRNDGHQVVTARAGDAFRAPGDGESPDYVINPVHADEYVKLLTAANASGKVEVIAHMWSVSPNDLAAAYNFDRDFDRNQELGFYSLLYLAQAVGRGMFADTVRLEVVTSGVHRITGDEIIQPEKAGILGLARVVPQEFPRVTSRSIELSGSSEHFLGAIAEDLYAEFRSAPADPMVALRNGRRMVEDFERVRLESNQEIGLRDNGVYLITGGLGSLGLVMAEHLFEAVKARLILVGRTALPDRAQWNDLLEGADNHNSTAERIRAIQSLEEKGAEILTFAADVSDEAEMRGVIQTATERFGPINGVMHMAGVAGGGVILLKTRDAAEQVMTPKVRGAVAIDHVFRDQPPLDFLALYSSIASFLGDFGQSDYCAANAVLDAVAARNASGAGPRTIVINWDIWQELGMTLNTEVPDHLRQMRQEMLAKGILNGEGVELFDRALASGLTQVIVSAQDLQGRIELGKSFAGEGFLQELQSSMGGGARSASTIKRNGSAAPAGAFEQRVAAVWQRVLGADQIGVSDNFFDLGGNSLIGLQLVSELSRELEMQIAPVTLFEFPTVSTLSRHLNPAGYGESRAAADELHERRKKLRQRSSPPDIAIIGMAGRFPGAADIEEFWDLLRAGAEPLTFFSDEELLSAGVPRSLVDNPEYVKTGSIINNIDKFDAGFFGFSPREAEVMDPQHRLFLECSWEAMERAGYDSLSYPGAVGVFAGSNISAYLLRMHTDPKVRESVNTFQALLGNDKDSLTTMVSYKLNLRGPSIAVQTFCSTSMVAIHMASQSLRTGECDMALAGGVRILVPINQGYLYEPGGIAPTDGHTRSFDAAANGSPFGNGVGIVLLKRLEDALEDGDQIHAVIKGSAINNDGSVKAGYTAPSVAGQAGVITAALEEAGVDPETVGYVEAHGSATELGDPIEVTALTKAFQSFTDKRGFCALGSVKSNFGHLDRAAGVTAVIKTALSLEHKQIPPSINFTEPNPKIDFENSPFYVNTRLAEWPLGASPRRAGVNSLGVGGTNVHIIMEEPPAVQPSSEAKPWQLLLLSAKSEAALDAYTFDLASHLSRRPNQNIADAAYTLQVGRRPLEFRRMLVCNGLEDAANTLGRMDPKRILTTYREEGERDVVFMFPGMGGQYKNMARGLYESEPVFKDIVDHCCDYLKPYLSFDLRSELYPDEPPTAAAAASAGAAATAAAPAVDFRKMVRARDTQDSASPLNRTLVSQPLLFVIEYALARLWMEWGIRPQAMIGYSLGEYVAACLAGVFSLEDGLKLVTERAKLIEALPAGALLAVGLPEEKAVELLGDDLSLMAMNGPEQCVISGPTDAIKALQDRLDSEGITYRQIQASHAFHSKMMLPIVESVEALLKGISLNAPLIPYISNVTGTWVRPEDATDPAYWCHHLCEPVRFSDGIQELLKKQRPILLEIGSPSLSSIVVQHASGSSDEQPFAFSLLRHSYETQPDLAHALNALGKLWLLGVQPDWTGFYAGQRRHRLLLPTYPFQRQRYWIETVPDREYAPKKDSSAGSCVYIPSWKRAAAASNGHSNISESEKVSQDQVSRWWILLDENGLGAKLASALEQSGRAVTRLAAGSRFEEHGQDRFTVDVSNPDDFRRLLDQEGGRPSSIVHMIGLSSESSNANAQESGLWNGLGAASVFSMSQALRSDEVEESIPVWIVSDGAHEVVGLEGLDASQVSLLGTSTALARQSPTLSIRNLDLIPDGFVSGSLQEKRLIKQLFSEVTNSASERVVAYRNGHRWIPTVASADAVAANGRESNGRPHNFIVINGLGSLGSVFCDHLIENSGNRLILVEQSELPARDLWNDWAAGDAEGVVANNIRRVQELEKRGAELFTGVDLSNPRAALGFIDSVKSRYGEVDGLLYVADRETPGDVSLPPNGSLKENMESVRALDQALSDRELDFRLLVSSTRSDNDNSPTDHAVSFFLDSFASKSARNGHQPWTSVTWDMPPDSSKAAKKEDLARTINQLLHFDGAPQVIVSASPLEEGWNKVEAFMETARVEADVHPIARYARPSLRVEYAEPRTETEKLIARIWGELLGVEKIGIYDNFLDLGGDSLQAVRLMSRMRDAFNQDFPVRLIFEVSTVAELAKAIAPEEEEVDEGAAMAELMSMLDNMSEDDAEAELLRRLEMSGEGEQE